jgi:hypothetical protein
LKIYVIEWNFKKSISNEKFKNKGEKKLFLFSKKINKKNQILSLGGGIVAF